MKWWHVSLILCGYGFFKEFRPSEPFISPFLINYKNFTEEQVNQDIYPVGTYSYLSLLIVVFLLTDWLRYKPVIIIGGLAGIVTWSLLAWGTTLPQMQVVEFVYGVFCASEIAYFTYMYAKVDKVHYQKVTSQARTGFLLGRSSSGLAAQLLVMYKAMDYLQLHYLTVAGLIIATVFSLFLPSVTQSVYFHRQVSKDSFTENVEENGRNELDFTDNESKIGGKKRFSAFHHLFSDFIDAYSNRYVVKWSLWWAIATCGYLQVTAYSQLLWQDIIHNENENQDLYYGFVEFTYTLLGAGMAFLIGFLNINWEIHGETVLAVTSLIQGGCLLYSSFLQTMAVAYLLYILFGVLYQAAITVASSEIAKNIREDSYALVFGINTFFALIVQSILTVIVITVLKSGIRTQFTVYGSYYLVMGLGFSIAAIVTIVRSVSSRDSS